MVMELIICGATRRIRKWSLITRNLELFKNRSIFLFQFLCMIIPKSRKNELLHCKNAAKIPNGDR